MKNKTSLLRSIWIIIVVFLIFTIRELPIYISVPFLIIALSAPLYREFSSAADLDERQIQLSRLSSHIAFYLYIALLLTIVIIEYFSQHKNPPNYFYMLLLTPLTLKFLTAVFQNFDAPQAASYIGLFFSSVFLIFSLLAHNIFSTEGIIQASPFIILISASLSAKRFPLFSGIIFSLSAILSLIIFKSNFDIYLKILLFSILTLPMLFCSYTLLTYRKEELQ
jgi:hypothetical protein